MIDDAVRAATHASVRRAMDGVLDRMAIDVVHMHGIDFHAYLPAAGPPMLVTLHLPPAWYPAAALRPERPEPGCMACRDRRTSSYGGSLIMRR